jgi:hypothetical protein
VNWRLPTTQAPALGEFADDRLTLRGFEQLLQSHISLTLVKGQAPHYNPQWNAPETAIRTLDRLGAATGHLPRKSLISSKNRSEAGS